MTSKLKNKFLGYQLCDNSVGVLFNDNTRIVLHEDAVKCQYVDKDYNEQFFTIDNYPSELKKKVSLVKYFRNYMNEHLLKVIRFINHTWTNRRKLKLT